VFDSETVGERGRILTISRVLQQLRISEISKEKGVKTGRSAFEAALSF